MSLSPVGTARSGFRLLALLAERGDRARGLIRNPDQAADLEAVGAEPVVCDLEGEDDVAAAVEGADAVVFAAGAGARQRPERKRTVDLGAAVRRSMEAGVRPLRDGQRDRARSDPSGRVEEGMRPYLEAKAEADRALEASGLEYTICRPGPLTDDPGRGTVTAGTAESSRARSPRDDVAATLAAVLDAPNTVGKTFNLVAGEAPIEQAVREL